MEVLFYCRSGYEADLLAELENKCAEKGHYGYAKFARHSAVLRFNMPQIAEPINHQGLIQSNKQLPKFEHLVFARQKMIVIGETSFESADRITEVLAYLSSNNATINEQNSLALFSEVFVEYADTETGKEVAKFCKKFAVPLRNSLRKSGLLTKKPTTKLPYLHLFFEHSGACLFAMSLPEDRSEHPLGIQRLKMPNDAPSRSTLKLEEAIKYFFTKEQEQACFIANMRATDLGACPGGWTYQLTQRGLIVEAVDHGLIDDKLMATGLVEYYSQDGFLYQPKEANVDWLVCDMIEQPTRVSELMLSWLTSGKANATIFNLKLPMNKRNKVVQAILENLQQKLNDRFEKIVIKAKHLYHNRDEVTVLIIVNSQLIDAFQENRRTKQFSKIE